MAVIATVAVRPLARRLAAAPPARSICDSSQPPKISPYGLASAGRAMARSAGSPWGGTLELSRHCIGLPSCIGRLEYPLTYLPPPLPQPVVPGHGASKDALPP